MTDIEKSILKDMQAQCDLIEGGIIRLAGALLRESADKAEDDRLMLEDVRLIEQRLKCALDVYDKRESELNEATAYYTRNDSEGEDSREGADDNHK